MVEKKKIGGRPGVVLDESLCVVVMRKPSCARWRCLLAVSCAASLSMMMMMMMMMSRAGLDAFKANNDARTLESNHFDNNVADFEDDDDEEEEVSSTMVRLASSEAPVKNVARNPKMSTESCGAKNAGDGRHARAFHGTCVGMAATEIEDDPWMTVDVGEEEEEEEEEAMEHSIYSIEIWVGLRKCNSIKFAENERCEWMKITDEKPMVVELLFRNDDDDDENVDENGVDVSPEETKKVFTDDGRLAYTWDNVQMYRRGKKNKSWSKRQRVVKGVRISLPGKQRQLSVQEVKIWARTESSSTSLISTSTMRACANDKIGDDCSTDLTIDWAHLPQNFLFARKNWNRTMYKSLEKSIEETQSSKCNTPREARTDSYNIGMGGKGAGFASTIHFLSGYLSDAHLENKPWVFGGRLNYAYNRNCANLKRAGDVECYFEPYSACGKIKRATFAKWKPYPAKTNRCTMPRNRCRDLAPWKRVPTNVKNYYSSQSPSSTSTLSYTKGLFFFRSAIVARMMRLNQKTVEELNLRAVKESIGFKHPIIGVHVRRGDACHTTGRKNRCRSFEEMYLPHIRTLSEKYGVNRVFLATDDDVFLRNVRSSPAANEFEFVNVNMDRSVYAASRLIERRTELYTEKSNVAHEMTLQALTDIFLLAEADAFIGHFLSNLSRLAIELSAVEKGFVPPFVSVDGQWCRHWKFCR